MKYNHILEFPDLFVIIYFIKLDHFNLIFTINLEILQNIINNEIKLFLTFLNFWQVFS